MDGEPPENGRANGEGQLGSSQDAVDAVTGALGTRLRGLRQERGQTLRSVAAAAEISPSLLSQIERGDVSPSLATLVAVAHALAVRPGVLLIDDGAEGPTSPVVRRGERRVLADEMCRREFMMHLDDPFLEVAEITVEPHGVSRPVLATHAGRDYGIVLEGEITVDLDGRRQVLAPGDYVAFDAETPHRLVNDTDDPARVHWIVAHGRAPLPPAPAKYRPR